MFGIGFGELILVFVIALVIFGPEKLPKIATSLGKAYYEFRKTFEEVKFDIENDVNDLDKEIEAPKEENENYTEEENEEQHKDETTSVIEEATPLESDGDKGEKSTGENN